MKVSNISNRLFRIFKESAFRAENSAHPAGDNKSIYKGGEYKLFTENPRYDFLIDQR